MSGLHQDALHAQVRGDRRHLARLVRLDAADGDQGVAALRDGFGDQVFQLARLVAAEGQPAVAVFALGVQVHLAAEVRAESCERLDRRDAEGERVTREIRVKLKEAKKLVPDERELVQLKNDRYNL